MKLAETNTIAATMAAAGSATCLYANVISGWTLRNFAASTVPPIPSSKLTANESSVTVNVTSSTRTGIRYQRGGRPGVSTEAIINNLHQVSSCRGAGEGTCPLHDALPTHRALE